MDATRAQRTIDRAGQVQVEQGPASGLSLKELDASQCEQVRSSRQRNPSVQVGKKYLSAVTALEELEKAMTTHITEPHRQLKRSDSVSYTHLTLPTSDLV